MEPVLVGALIGTAVAMAKWGGTVIGHAMRWVAGQVAEEMVEQLDNRLKLPQMREADAAMLAAAATIQRELRPNGGASLTDRVERLEIDVARIVRHLEREEGEP